MASIFLERLDCNTITLDLDVASPIASIHHTIKEDRICPVMKPAPKKRPRSRPRSPSHPPPARLKIPHVLDIFEIVVYINQDQSFTMKVCPSRTVADVLKEIMAKLDKDSGDLFDGTQILKFTARRQDHESLSDGADSSAMSVILGCFESLSRGLSAVFQQMQSGRSGSVPRVLRTPWCEVGEGVLAQEDRQHLPPHGQEIDHDDDDNFPQSAADDEESDGRMFHERVGKWSDKDVDEYWKKENSIAKDQIQDDGIVDLTQDEPLPKAAPEVPPIGFRSTVLDNPRRKVGGAPKRVIKELDLCGSASGNEPSQRPPSRPSSSAAAAAIGVWAPPAPVQAKATSHAKALPVARTPTAKDRHDAELRRIEGQRKEDDRQQRPKPTSIAESSTSGKLSLPQVLENIRYAKQMYDAEHRSHGGQRQWRPKQSIRDAHDSKLSWHGNEEDQEHWTADPLWQHQEPWKEWHSRKGWSFAPSSSGGAAHGGQKRARVSDGREQPVSELADKIHVGGDIYHKQKPLNTSDKTCNRTRRSDVASGHG